MNKNDLLNYKNNLQNINLIIYGTFFLTIFFLTTTGSAS